MKMLGREETVTAFTCFSFGRQAGIVAYNFPKPNKTRQYICLLRGFLVALIAIIIWSLYLDQRINQHKTFWTEKLPFCLMNQELRNRQLKWVGYGHKESLWPVQGLNHNYFHTARMKKQFQVVTQTFLKNLPGSHPAGKFGWQTKQQ